MTIIIPTDLAFKMLDSSRMVIEIFLILSYSDKDVKVCGVRSILFYSILL